jgi:hypothetical protein
LGLRGAESLPGVEGLAEERVDRLGELGAGLVRGDVERADRVARRDEHDLVVGLSGEVVQECDDRDRAEAAIARFALAPAG